MLQIARKFVAEKEPSKLHSVVSALIVNHTINCVDYDHECDKFYEFLTLAEDISRDGTISPDEKVRLIATSAELEKTILQVREKLRKDWTQRKKKQ